MQHSCPACGVVVDALRARHVSVVVDGHRPRVLRYCSAACRKQGPAPAPVEEVCDKLPSRGARARTASLLVAAGVAVGTVLVLAGHGSLDHAAAALPAMPTPPAAPVVDDRPMYGPEKPPFELVDERDAAWVHPLAGPRRRLPERPTRRFGAVRDHDSPESCRQGHCGVDIGETRGEPVLAVHDGIVERVVRDENANGGRYVRLIHRDGTVYTQYFHLDTIPADIVPGKPVRAGDVIGTVGTTGVKRAGPHLHFTVSTRERPDAEEIYIDPEPLLSLWPLAPARR